VADAGNDALLGVPAASALDALVFGGATRAWRDVMVAGRWVLQDHAHAQSAIAAARFARTMAALWSPAR